MDRITIQYHGLTGSIRQWADFLGIGYYTLLARIRRGWSAEKALETPVCYTGGGRKTHGKTGTKEHRAWKSMLGRCRYQKYIAYDRYGGRGISVCERWQERFEDFLADVGPAPSPHHSLGRVDNDGDYEPGNVVWQTGSEQAKNRASPRRGQGAK